MGYCLRKAGSLSYGDAAVAEAGTFTQRILSFTVKFKQRCVVWALFSILQLLFGETVFRHFHKKGGIGVFVFRSPSVTRKCQVNLRAPNWARKVFESNNRRLLSAFSLFIEREKNPKSDDRPPRNSCSPPLTATPIWRRLH